MDPASFAASLLTLLAAAGATCEFVYNFILDIQEVPDEIHSQAIKLQCLRHSISSLIGIYEENNVLPEFQLDPFLEIHVRRFLDEIRDIESKIKRSSTQIRGSRTRQLRTRLTWLSSDRQLRKFYSSLDDWIKIFSTVVSRTELELLTRISKQTASLQSIPPTVAPECIVRSNEISPTGGEKRNRVLAGHQVEPDINKQQILNGTKYDKFKQGTHLPKALSLYLSQQTDLVGLRILHWTMITLGGWSADLQVGPAMLRRWSDKGKPIYEIVSWRKGICLNLTLRTNRLLSRQIKLRMAGIVQAPTLKVSYTLTVCGMLRTTSAAYRACHVGDWLALRALLGNGEVRITDTTGFGETLLHIAARRNHYEIVAGLLQEGAAVDAENDFRETPLQAAVNKNCDYSVSSCLLSFGADLNHQDISGRTPLHTFFNKSSRAIIEYHQEDLDSTTQDSHGKNIAHYVSWSKSSVLADILRCCRGNLDSLDTVDDMGRTAIFFACQRGNIELMEYYLSKADATMIRPDWQGQTLMHYATESGRSAQAIHMLSCYGFDARAIDHHGTTVLHQAASAGKIAAIQKLIELGAIEDLSALDGSSRTPLQVATVCGRTEAMELLRSLCDDAEIPTVLEELLAGDEKGQEHAAEIRVYLHRHPQALFGFGVFIVVLYLYFII